MVQIYFFDDFATQIHKSNNWLRENLVDEQNQKNHDFNQVAPVNFLSQNWLTCESDCQRILSHFFVILSTKLKMAIHTDFFAVIM